MKEREINTTVKHGRKEEMKITSIACRFHCSNCVYNRCKVVFFPPCFILITNELNSSVHEICTKCCMGKRLQCIWDHTSTVGVYHAVLKKKGNIADSRAAILYVEYS